MSNLISLLAATAELTVVTDRQQADGEMETKEGKDRLSLLVHVGAAISLSEDHW